MLSQLMACLQAAASDMMEEEGQQEAEQQEEGELQEEHCQLEEEEMLGGDEALLGSPHMTVSHSFRSSLSAGDLLTRLWCTDQP